MYKVPASCNVYTVHSCSCIMYIHVQYMYVHVHVPLHNLAGRGSVHLFLLLVALEGLPVAVAATQ